MLFLHEESLELLDCYAARFKTLPFVLKRGNIKTSRLKPEMGLRKERGFGVMIKTR